MFFNAFPTSSSFLNMWITSVFFDESQTFDEETKQVGEMLLKQPQTSITVNVAVDSPVAHTRWLILWHVWVSGDSNGRESLRCNIVYETCWLDVNYWRTAQTALSRVFVKLVKNNFVIAPLCKRKHRCYFHSVIIAVTCFCLVKQKLL